MFTRILLPDWSLAGKQGGTRSYGTFTSLHTVGLWGTTAKAPISAVTLNCFQLEYYLISFDINSEFMVIY